MKLKFLFIDRILKLYLLIIGLLFGGLIFLTVFFQLNITSKGSGKVIPANWIDVIPEYSGKIKKMLVKEGDKVIKGQILFTFENKDRKVELKEAEIRIFELKSTQEKLIWKIQLLEKEINTAIAEAEANLKITELYLQKVLKGPQKSEVQLAKNKIERNKNDVEAKKKLLEIKKSTTFLQNDLKILDLEADIQRLKMNILLKKETIKNNIEIEKANLNQIELRLRQMRSGTKPEELKIAKGKILSAKLEMVVLNKIFIRSNELYKLSMTSFSELEKAQSDKKRAEIKLQLSIDELNLLNNKYSEIEIEQTLAEVDRLKATLRNAIIKTKEFELMELELSIKKNSFEKEKKRWKALTEIELNQAREDYYRAKIDLKIAKNEYDQVLNKFDHNEIKTAEAQIVLTKTQVQKVSARKKEPELLKKDLQMTVETLNKEKKKFDLAKEKLDFADVRSPIPGFVLTHDTVHLVGKTFNRGDSVIKIGDSSTFLITAVVSEHDFPLVKKGQNAKVLIKPFPRGEYELFKASVISIGADSQDASVSLLTSDSISKKTNNKGKVFPIILRLKKPYGMTLFDQYYEIKPGFSAEVEIITKSERIIMLFFRRILRLKGVVNTDNINFVKNQ
jgi:multidrug resistance efflux pump